MVFSDEAYSSLTYDKEYSSISKYCNKEDVVLINSFSKKYAMTGWRIGYVVADEAFINTVVKFQQNMAVCVATPNQYAAIEAMSNSDKYTYNIKEVFKKRRDVLKNELDKIPSLKCRLPQGTFYAFIDISETGMKSKSFCFDLLEKEHVATIPGIAFGESFDNYVRLAFTLKEDKIKEGIGRIKHFIIQ